MLVATVSLEEIETISYIGFIYFKTETDQLNQNNLLLTPLYVHKLNAIYFLQVMFLQGMLLTWLALRTSFSFLVPRLSFFETLH